MIERWRKPWFVHRPSQALRRIATAKSTFISRGDKSGTHAAELRYWQQAGLDLAAIRAAIMAAAPGAIEIGSRAAAIRAAVDSLQADDVLIVAGKGHEDYQILGTTKIHFDDRDVVRHQLVQQIVRAYDAYTKQGKPPVA